MADYGKLLFLGLIQGITEFLPVSSSGHLSLIGHIFKIGENQLFWTAGLHAGTLLSIIVYFRKDLIKILFSILPGKRIEKKDKRNYKKLLFLIILGSIPAAAAGLIFFSFFKQIFQNVKLVMAALVLNGCWLIFCERISAKKKAKLDLKDLGWKQAFLIGLAQMCALIPGISRSGAAIGSAYLCGLKKELAFNFAFLLAIPVVAGALFLSIGKLNCSLLFLMSIILFTALVGYAALCLLSKIVKKAGLIYFAFYCWTAAVWAYILI